MSLLKNIPSLRAEKNQNLDTLTGFNDIFIKKTKVESRLGELSLKTMKNKFAFFKYN